MVEDSYLTVRGEVSCWVLRDGIPVEHSHVKNLVVNGSRPFFADLMRGAPFSSALKVIAIGDSATPGTAITQTQLASERFRTTLPAADTDTPLAANLLQTTGGSTRVLLRQELKPFASGAGIGSPSSPLSSQVTIREYGLFGDFIVIADPSTAPSSLTTTAGFVSAGTYDIKYSWANDTGETLLSSSAQIVLGGTSGFSFTLPARPSTAKKSKIYISTGGGTYYFYDETAASSYTVTTQPPTGPSGAHPGFNTSALPGETNKGRMLNRALIGPHTLNPSGDSILVEAVILFG